MIFLPLPRAIDTTIHTLTLKGATMAEQKKSTDIKPKNPQLAQKREETIDQISRLIGKLNMSELQNLSDYVVAKTKSLNWSLDRRMNVSIKIPQTHEAKMVSSIGMLLDVVLDQGQRSLATAPLQEVDKRFTDYKKLRLEISEAVEAFSPILLRAGKQGLIKKGDAATLYHQIVAFHNDCKKYNISPDDPLAEEKLAEAKSNANAEITQK